MVEHQEDAIGEEDEVIDANVDDEDEAMEVVELGDDDEEEEDSDYFEGIYLCQLRACRFEPEHATLYLRHCFPGLVLCTFRRYSSPPSPLPVFMHTRAQTHGRFTCPPFFVHHPPSPRTIPFQSLKTTWSTRPRSCWPLSPDTLRRLNACAGLLLAGGAQPHLGRRERGAEGDCEVR